MRVGLRLALGRAARRKLSLLPIVGVPRDLVLMRSTRPNTRGSRLSVLSLRLMRGVSRSSTSNAVDRHTRRCVVLIVWLLRSRLSWGRLSLGKLDRRFGLILLPSMGLLRVWLLLLRLLVMRILGLCSIWIVSMWRRVTMF